MHIYAVTCAHVIAGGSTTIRLNTKSGKPDHLEREAADWFQEPGGADLAVMPIDLSDAHKYAFNSTEDFLDAAKISEFGIGQGDDVFMAGRFNMVQGVKQNTPALTFGNISMMPGEPLKGGPVGPQESFMVEMRSKTGFSGSPVFVYIAPTEMRMEVPKWSAMQAGIFYGPWLLGVHWGQIPLYTKVLGPETDQHGRRIPVDEGWDVEMMSGMNGVVPAWKLTEFIMEDPDLIDLRSQRIEAAKQEPHAIPQSEVSESEPPTKGGNPQHREDFNRLLGEAMKEQKPDD